MDSKLPTPLLLALILSSCSTGATRVHRDVASSNASDNASAPISCSDASLLQIYTEAAERADRSNRLILASDQFIDQAKKLVSEEQWISFGEKASGSGLALSAGTLAATGLVAGAAVQTGTAILVGFSTSGAAIGGTGLLLKHDSGEFNVQRIGNSVLDASLPQNVPVISELQMSIDVQSIYDELAKAHLKISDQYNQATSALPLDSQGNIQTHWYKLGADQLLYMQAKLAETQARRKLYVLEHLITSELSTNLKKVCDALGD